MKLIVSWIVACVVIAHAACSRDSAPIAAPPAPPPAAELQDMTNLVADGASGALSDDAFRLRMSPSVAPLPAAERQLVHTAELDLIVPDAEAAGRRISALADSLGGYIASSSATRRNDLMHVKASVRVPADRFGALLEGVRRLGLRVQRESRSTDDVTDRVADLDGRLRTLRATETELQALLGESQQRGREMEDVMAIYRELTTIRSTIELLQDQQKGLHDQVAMAALEVELVPDVAARPVVTEGWRPGSTAREALRSLLAVGRGLGDAVIFAAIVLLPLAALFTAVVTPPLLVGRAAIRRLRSRRAAA